MAKKAASKGIKKPSSGKGIKKNPTPPNGDGKKRKKKSERRIVPGLKLLAPGRSFDGKAKDTIESIAKMRIRQIVDEMRLLMDQSKGTVFQEKHLETALKQLGEKDQFNSIKTKVDKNKGNSAELKEALRLTVLVPGKKKETHSIVAHGSVRKLMKRYLNDAPLNEETSYIVATLLRDDVDAIVQGAVKMLKDKTSRIMNAHVGASILQNEKLNEKYGKGIEDSSVGHATKLSTDEKTKLDPKKK